MVRFSNGDSFRWKVASGAWGFNARGYPEILCSPRSFLALLEVPPREWPGLLRTGFALFVEMVLLFVGILDPQRFAFTTKTLSARSIKGNPLNAWIRSIPHGYVNAVGLANPGLLSWIAASLPSLARRGIRPIVSLAPNTVGEMRLMIELLHSQRGQVRAIELNPGCPNTTEGLRMFQDPQAVVTIVHSARTRLVELGWDCPLILKLSAAHDWNAIITATSVEIDAFELINSVPWKMRFGDLPSPLAEFKGGGVSGPQVFPIMLNIVREARNLTIKPIFACGGIDSLATARAALAAGASGVTIGTGFITNGWQLARLPDRLSA